MINLWLDLGNTRLKYWLIADGQVLLFDAKEHLKAPNELLFGLLGVFKQYPIAFVGVSSVLGDKINGQIAYTLAQLGVKFEFAKVNDAHALMNSVYNPCELGVDRWLQMLGVVDGRARCVIGCGTALTVDIIEDRTHLGGYILPNAYMQRHALYAGTQQIAVKAGRFDSLLLGKTTFDAVNHGILFGIVATVHAVMAQYPTHEMTLTGGGALILSAHLQHPVTVAPDLLLLGLRRYFGRV